LIRRRNVRGKHIAVGLAIALAVVCGCKSKKTSKKEAEDKVATLSVQGLAAVPANATIAIGADVGALAKSPIVARALERMFTRDPGLQAELSKVLRACNLDLASDVFSATIALIPNAKAGTDSLLVSKGHFEEGKIVACLGKAMGDTVGSRLETTEFQGRPTYHQVGGEGPGLWLAFGSSDTILVSSGQEALQAALGDGPKLADGSAGIAKYLSRANTKADIWAIGEIEGAVGAGLVAATGGQVKAPVAVIASVDLSAGLALSADLLMASKEDANTLISQAKSQLSAVALVVQIDSLGRMVQKAELSADALWARLRWSITNEELQELLGANLSGLSPGIDKQGARDENPAPKSETERDTQDAN